MILLVPLAVAMPTFTGNAEDVRLASQAWATAVECTSREGTALAIVPIVRGSPGIEWAAGEASIVDGRLTKITLLPDAPQSILAHEVSHAWFHRGASVVVEGGAEAVAACISERLGGAWGAMEPEFPQYFEVLPDLLRWDEHDATHSTLAIGAAYYAARRIFRVARRILPPYQLWNPSWDSLEPLLDALEHAGPRGEGLLRALRAGAPGLREGLSDPDLDGLINLEEAALGTDPALRDSDGDGWWDGFAPIPDAVPVARDGTPVCLPRVPEGSTTTPIRSGGFLGSIPSPGLNTASVPNQTGLQFPGEWWRVGGGIWVAPDVDATTVLVENRRCGYHPLVTVLGPDTPDRSWAELAADIGSGMSRLRSSGGHRLLVRIVDHARWVTVVTHVQEQYVEIDVPTSAFALDRDIAGTIAALHAQAESPAQSLGPALAMAVAVSALGHDKVGAVNVTAQEVRPWIKAIDGCPTGWRGVLEMKCHL